MTARDIAIENEILRVEVGSTLHGTGIPGQEDRDEMGICIPPPEYVIGLKQFEHYIYRSAGEGNRSGPDDLDLTYYSLRKFVKLALDGNPSILLMLFIPKEKIFVNSDIGKSLMANSYFFWSKKAADRFLGYIQSQKMGLTGERKSGVPKRPDIVEQFGFDTKYAMHAVRLGFQGVEFLKTANITLPMGKIEGDICRGIRHGNYTLPEVLQIIEETEVELKQLKDSEDIPDEPRYELANRWLINAHTEWWNRDFH